MNQSEEKYIERVLNKTSIVECIINGLTKVGSDLLHDERETNDHIFYYILDGGLMLEIEGGFYSLDPGSCFWIKPGVIHTIKTSPKHQMCRLYHHRFQVLSAGEVDKRSFIQHKAFELEGYFYETFHRVRSPLINQMRLKITLSNLMLAISDHDPKYHLSDEKNKLDLNVYRRIQDAFDLEPTRNWNARDLSQIAELSLDYFSVLFKRTTGISPKSWLLKQKLQRGAAILLESSESISRCADQLGFSDIYHFSRSFKRQYGLSPKEWRKKHG